MLCCCIIKDVQIFRRGWNIIYSYQFYFRNNIDKFQINWVELFKGFRNKVIVLVFFYLFNLGSFLILNYINKLFLKIFVVEKIVKVYYYFI